LDLQSLSRAIYAHNVVYEGRFKLATATEFRLVISYLMTNLNPVSKRNKIANFSTRVTGVSGKAYIDAADTAARAATTVGQLITATNALTLGIPQKWGVHFEEVDLAAVPPASSAGAYPFDKFAASLLASGENSQVTIPARKDSAVVFESDGVSLVLDDGAAVEDWISAFETVALDEDLHAPNVERMFVTS
jgi:hypothetical protein